MIKVTAACVAALMAVPASAQSGFGDELGKFGEWTAYAEVDQMSDAVQCTAIFRQRDNVQYSGTSFAISLRGRGGVSSYNLRLDGGPADGLKLASSDEKAIQAVYLSGQQLVRVEASARLRIEILTVLGDLVFEDIDVSPLDEIKAAFLKAGCAA